MIHRSIVMHRRTLLRTGAGAAAMLALSARAQPAEDWPSRPIRFIVPFAPGGATDLIGRFAAAKLSEALKQQFVVDNRPGAGATLGSDIVAKAAPDGYTLLLSNSGSIAVAPGLFRNVPYDPMKHFTHVALVATTPTVLVVNPSFPARSVAEFIALAKAQPGGLTFATSGNGSSAHLVGELLMAEAGIRMVHVPYRGAGPAMVDVLSNHVPIMFDSLGSSSTNIRSGKLRALGMSAGHRQKGFPDLPSFAEQGLPNVVSTSWFGVSGPPGLPTSIRMRLADAIVKMVQSPDVQAKLADLEFEPATIAPEDFTRMIGGEVERWGTNIRRFGIKLD
jgi:tripartite-type tricarboxylate transporter receptor subunit TctC